MTTNHKFEVLPELRLVIRPDIILDSPRIDRDNLGTMVFRTDSHSRNDNPTGDTEPFGDMRDEINWLLCPSTSGPLFSHYFNSDYNDREFRLQEKIPDHVKGFDKAVQQIRDYLDAELIREFHKRYIALALYYYAERGEACIVPGLLSEDDLDNADGLIYVSRHDVEKEHINSGMAVDILKGECQEYSQWLSGNVYGFTIEDEEGNIYEGVTGFYGDDPLQNGMTDHIADEHKHLLDSPIYKYGD